MGDQIYGGTGGGACPEARALRVLLDDERHDLGRQRPVAHGVAAGVDTAEERARFELADFQVAADERDRADVRVRLRDDPDLHALRKLVGLRLANVTTAAAKGVTLHQIMRQTRHKSERVAMTYIRPATVFRNNPTQGLGDEEEPKK